MIKAITVRSWSGFVKAIDNVRKEYMNYRRELSNGELFEKKNLILFRGQSNSKWELETTLERKSQEKYCVLDYIRLTNRCASQIETFTDKDWKLSPFNEIEETLNKDSDPFRVNIPHYDYLIYLRHHGFPFPLLDWTESPYIAAFFAYATAVDQNPAVYCYIERPNLVKGGSSGEPQIQLMGPYVKTHTRHFSQKAWYTISTIYDYSDEKHYFCKHEKVFSKNDDRQDLLIKITLPIKERKKALFHLNDYNINHFTLFNSEDSLIKTLEMKEFDLIK
ncbi:FRG domain-containing protein [bacterium]|nr:FRG domain-containing protein [bacterium]